MKGGVQDEHPVNFSVVILVLMRTPFGMKDEHSMRSLESPGSYHAYAGTKGEEASLLSWASSAARG